MTTDGVLTDEFAIPTENANPLALVAGARRQRCTSPSTRTAQSRG